MLKDGKKRSLREDSDDEMAGPDPFQNETVLGEGNESYRVYDQLGDVPTAGVDMRGGDYAAGGKLGQAVDGCVLFLEAFSKKTGVKSCSSCVHWKNRES